MAGLPLQSGRRLSGIIGLFAAGLVAQTYPPAFQPAPPSRAPVRGAQPEVRRARLVEIDADQFSVPAAAEFHTNRSRMPARLFELNLFDDVSFRARLDRAEVAWDGKTVVWSGALEQTRRGQVILAATGKLVSATITTDDGDVYQVRHATGTLHWVQEMDFSQLPPEAEPIPVFTPEGARAPEAATDDGSILDVMVVYTPGARQAAGGTAQMNNLVSLGVAETNQGYANSGVIQRIRLVYSGEVNYTESGSFTTDLNRLTNASDGYMDEVHGIRDTVHADLVSLWVTSGDACGIAWLMTTESVSFANRAFSVVRRDCATGFYSFGHEMGHNQGSTHDVANSSGPGVFSYSYGYQQQTLAPYFRTVMAYACAGPVNCPRINFWSSPTNTYSGIATGASNTNNALSLNNTRDTAANWRTSSATTISINPASADFTAAGGTGVITVTSNTSWTATRSDTWITITSGSSGSGNGAVAFSVAANTSNAARTGLITIGGVPFTITEAGAAACSLTAISIPQTMTGSWSSSDCNSPQRTGRFADRYSFTGTAGQQVTIRLSSADADSYLYLIGPNGTVLVEDDDSGGGLNSRIPASGFFTLPSGGVYLIEATTFGAGETGVYTLQADVPSACSYSISPGTRTVDTNLNNGSITITTAAGCAWTAASNATWISITSAGNGAGSGTVDYSVQANSAASSRTGTVTVAGQTFTLTQAGNSVACTASSVAVGQELAGSLAAGDCASLFRGGGYLADRYSLAGTAGQQVRVELASGQFDAYLYLVSPNGTLLAEDDDSGGSSDARIPPTGLFTFPATGVYVIEATTFYAGATGAYLLRVSGGGCTYSLSASTFQAAAGGAAGSVTVTAPNGCAWTVTGRPDWIAIASGSSGSGNGTVSFTVSPNSGTLPRSAGFQIAGVSFTVFQAGVSTPLRFVAVTPCRLADTRAGQGQTGLFGPPLLAGGTSREIPVPTGACGIPTTARAYSINVTVVPRGPLSYLTVWPTGQAQPLVSTLNSFEGRVVANAAIVPAGANGSVQVFVTNSTDLIVDINGYFTP